MRYPVVIHKQKDSAYGVTVPDIPGCFSAGETIDEALENVREAIYAHLDLITDAGGDVANARPIEAHQASGDYAGGTWAFVDVNVDDLLGPAERVNITIPKRALQKIDAAASSTHLTRSSLLMKGALELIGVSEGQGGYKAFSAAGKPVRRPAGAAGVIKAAGGRNAKATVARSEAGARVAKAGTPARQRPAQRKPSR